MAGSSSLGDGRIEASFPIEIKLNPLQSPEEILVTGVIRDITLCKKAEANPVQKVEELNRSHKEL
jgi:hypothetical protein